ncbi:MAG: ABC transporter ATP-binding protein [Acidobacteria bacterium]|nr:ABC transporter ATP-binding protein [Acidobacteriota bacterium]
MKLLTTTGLTKSYHLKPAVKNLDLTVGERTLHGLIGPNGSGKTTTLQMLTGVFPAGRGEIRIFGKQFHTDSLDIKAKIGYVPEILPLFEHLKADENLYFIGRLYGLDAKTSKARTDELLHAFELNGVRSDFVHTYSKGMKKKLAFLCAIIHNPKLLILDELFEGLDFITSFRIQEILRKYTEKGGTVLVSSNNLRLVEAFCNEVSVLHQGELVFSGDIQEVKKMGMRLSRKEGLSGLESVFLNAVGDQAEPEMPEWLNGF